MAVGGRAAAFGPGLAEDLIAPRRRAVGEHGDLLADDVEPPRAVRRCNYHRLYGHRCPLPSIPSSLFKIVVS
jgi:hypothetical protein